MDCPQPGRKIDDFWCKFHDLQVWSLKERRVSLQNLPVVFPYRFYEAFKKTQSGYGKGDARMGFFQFADFFRKT